MQLTIPQQYLVRLNEDLIYHFSLHNDGSLHYKTYSNNNILLNDNELLSNVINFSVTVDAYEGIHLICITPKGELQHYINRDNNWSYKTISRFDIKSNIYKYLTLYVDDEYTHLLYVKTNLLTQDLSTIEHMYWDRKNVNRIAVNSYIHGKYTSPLQVSLDNPGNFHIVYKVFYKDNHQLYYNKFDISTKIWTIGELITDLQEEHSHPYLFIDKKQNLHLVWCTIEQNNFILKYKRKHNIIDIKPKWSNVQILSDKNSNYFSPILIQELDTLKIYCRQNDKIIEIISNDFGRSWTDSINNKPFTIEEPEIIQYSGNPQIDDIYLAKHVYGNVKNTIQIIGINLFGNKKESQPPSIQSAPDQKQDSPINADKGTNISEKIDTDKGIDIEKGIDAKISPDRDMFNLIKDMDDKINTILSQIAECESKSHLTDTSIQEINYTTCEIKQNNNKIIDFDKPDNIANNTGKSNDIINELLSDYNILEEQFFELKEKKQKLAKSISDHETDLNLLEEKIVGYKKQMLIFQEKLDNIASNNGMFQRFINFFK